MFFHTTFFPNKTQIERLRHDQTGGQSKKTHNKAGFIILFRRKQKCRAELETFEIKFYGQRSMLMSYPS